MIYEVLVTMCQTINEAAQRGPLFIVKKEDIMSRIENKLMVRVSFCYAADVDNDDKRMVVFKDHVWPQGEEPTEYNKKVDQLADDCAASVILVLFYKGLEKYNIDNKVAINKISVQKTAGE